MSGSRRHSASRARDGSRCPQSRPAVLALVVLSAACEGYSGPASGGWTAVTDTAGDTVTVRTVSGSVWGDAAVLVPEVTIGSMDGADEYILGSPDALAVGADGTIYVLDTQVPVLRAYGADGHWIANVGRKGGGPGEYESPDGIAVLSDGRLLVRDPPNGRITVFGADRGYIEEWPLSGGFNTSRRFYTDAGDTSYVNALLERGVGPWDWKFGLIRYSPRGELLDTIAAPTWDHDFAQVTASREHSSSVRTVPFTPQVAWTFSPLGYMLGGLATDYRIDLFHSDGTVLRLEREWTPVHVQAAEADERRRRITEGLQRQYGGWRWNGPGVPETKPPFKDMFASAEGNIWVLISTKGQPVMSEAEAREEEQATQRVPLRFVEPPAFDVFDPDGRYLGQVNAPTSLVVEPEPVVRGDYMWAVARNDLDVPAVVRFRIVHSETATVMR